MTKPRSARRMTVTTVTTAVATVVAMVLGGCTGASTDSASTDRAGGPPAASVTSRSAPDQGGDSGQDSGQDSDQGSGQDSDQGHDPGEEAGSGAEEDEEPGGPQAPADYLDRRYTSGRRITQAEVDRGIRQANALAAGPGHWRLVGPTNIGGRLTEVAPDPHHEGTVYIAASGGGVWKTTDAGRTFHSVWPTRLTQTIGSLAIGSDGTLWAGTGEANPSGGGLTFFGTGMYKSTDGGKHWQFAGLPDSGAIGKIAVDPKNPHRVFAAASGNLSGSAGQRGIYRLRPNGTWQLVLRTRNRTTGGIDIAIDPKNPQRVFAALWDHKRNNGARTYGGVGSGLFRSTDGGTHWKRLQNVIGTASTDKSGSGLKSDPSLGRIGVAVAPSNPNRVYVISGTTYGLDKGFYVSNDGGNTFRPGGHAGGNSGYEWWFARLWVDPKNQDHLFNADVGLRESTDGGQTWHYSNGVHADQHGMAWDPDRQGHPDRVYLGNDGGFYHSTANGANSSWVHAQYEPWNQSYHLAVAADDPSRLATGLQDNGSVRTWTNNTPPRNLTQWNAYGGGDGHEVLIDYENHNIYYECSQVGYCSRHQDVNGKQTVTPFGHRHSTRITTDAPIILDPRDHNVVYFGGNVLDRSTDGGKTFTAISPAGNFLTGPVPKNEEDQGPFYGGEYGTITWIAPAKSAPHTIYLGTDTGNVWKTTDLGKHWRKFSHSLLPKRWVNSIQVDPRNADHVFVAFSGYREGDMSAAVWETTNGGRTWRNISGLLPNAPVEMLAYDKPHNLLYAATDLGLFYAKAGERAWKRVGHGLPNTPILDVKFSGNGKTLFAATFGRSVWRMPAPAR